MLWLAGGEFIRLIQFAGIFLIVMALTSAITISSQMTSNLSVLLSIFFLAITPVMIRNMLMGLTEWLAIVLMLFAVAVQHKNLAISLLLLGLAVFVRQTFLPVALVAVLPLTITTKRNVIPLLMFLSILSLPLWHNVHYAGTWRYFADYSWWADLMGMDQRSFFLFSMVIPYQWVFLQYLGIDLGFFHPVSFVMGIMFIPLGWYLVIKIGKEMLNTSRLWFLLSLGALMLLVWPSLAYNGTAWFPRFQLFNFTSFLFLYLFGRKAINEANGYRIGRFW
jgi:hypothetical protein